MPQPQPAPPPDGPTWSELHEQIDRAQADWDDATQGLTGDERPPDAPPQPPALSTPEPAPVTPDDEALWDAAQVHSHVANALLLYADTLSRVAVSQQATWDPPQRMLRGHHPYPRIRDITNKGWRDFRGAAHTVSKQPDRGPVIDLRGDPIDARAFVIRGLGHLQEHVQTMRRLTPNS